jgi:hypothetical protein
MLAWQSEPTVSAEDRWSILNNSRTTAYNDLALARYYTLLAALDGGWKAERKRSSLGRPPASWRLAQGLFAFSRNLYISW